MVGDPQYATNTKSPLEAQSNIETSRAQIENSHTIIPYASSPTPLGQTVDTQERIGGENTRSSPHDRTLPLGRNNYTKCDSWWYDRSIEKRGGKWIDDQEWTVGRMNLQAAKDGEGMDLEELTKPTLTHKETAYNSILAVYFLGLDVIVIHAKKLID